MGTPASLVCAGSQADVTWSNRSPCTDIRRIAVQYRPHGAPQPSASKVPHFTPYSPPHTHTLRATFVMFFPKMFSTFTCINTMLQRYV